jgi:hypothetical protein
LNSGSRRCISATLILNYEGLISPIVSAIQALSAEITSIENTVAGFAQSFTTSELTFNRAAGNEVDTQTLCLTDGPNDQTPICVTKAQLAAILSSAVTRRASETVSQSDTQTSSSTLPESVSSDTPPVIQINGDDPAIVQVGGHLQRPGRHITGPEQD